VLLTPPLFNPNFGGVPVAPDRRCWASASTWALSYSAVKLSSKNSNVFDHGTWTLRTDGQTDRRTDGQTTYCRITALCASIARNKFNGCLAQLAVRARHAQCAW